MFLSKISAFGNTEPRDDVDSPISTISLKKAFPKKEKICDQLRTHLEEKFQFRGDIEYGMVAGYEGGREVKRPTVTITMASYYSIPRLTGNSENPIMDQLLQTAATEFLDSKTSFGRSKMMVAVHDHAGPNVGFGDGFQYQVFHDKQIVRETNVEDGAQKNIDFHDVPVALKNGLHL